MQPTVIFRDFEERDIDFIYKCKNDEQLNSMIVGHYRPFTYEEATQWVRGCMGEHETYKFWAVCTNDEEKRIVGWTSLSDINNLDKSAFFHSTVIGDRNFQNGMAFIECFRHIFNYVFNVLQFHRLGASYLETHKASVIFNDACYLKVEGIQRDAILKSGKYENIIQASILFDEYKFHEQNGDYERGVIMRRIIEKMRKKEKV